jgi:excisionase family DNA binding protein
MSRTSTPAGLPRAQSGHSPRETLARQRSTDGQGIHDPLSKRLYTLKEAAEYLGRSEWGMRDLVYAGRIPFVKGKMDRKYFFDVADLMGFVDLNKSSYAV